MTTATEQSLVRLATPYLEVETWSTSLVEDTIGRHLASARLAAKRTKRKGGDQPPSIQTWLVEEPRLEGLGGDRS
jgi:hypothetical protein